MHKSCQYALRVACSVAMACALLPAVAFAQGETGAQENEQAYVAQQEYTVSSEAPTSILKTDVSKLASVDSDAAKTVKAYFSARADEVGGESTVADDKKVDASSTVVKESNERADGFKDLEERANISITDTQTNVLVTEVEEKDSKFEVSAYEQTVITYDDLSDGKGGSDTAIIGTDHSLTVKASDAEATIVADKYDESDINGVDTTNGAVVEAQGTPEKSESSTKEVSSAEKSETSAEAKTGEDTADAEDDPAAAGVASGEDEATAAADETDVAGKVAAAVSGAAASLTAKTAYAAAPVYDTAYSPAAAIAYSNKYWSKYNTAYRNFNPDGGDCANFVSQCMNAGGFTQKGTSYISTSSWFYKSCNDYSQSWTYCPTMVSALKKRGAYVSNPTSSQVFPGSPVIYKSNGVWAHATICVGYNSAGTPVINAHNNDRYHVPYTYWDTTRCTIQLTRSASYSAAVASASAETFTTGLPGVSTTANATATMTWRIGGDGSSVTLAKFQGSATGLTIPQSIKGSNGKTYRISGIDEGVFIGNRYLKTVKIESSFGTVPKSLFKYCTSLSSVYLGPSVTYIGPKAFKGCTALTKVTGAKNLTTIDYEAFRGATRLASMPKLYKVTVLGKSAFRNCDALTSVPSMPVVSVLSDYSFYDCDKLKYATFKSPYLRYVGVSCFKSANSLYKVRIYSTKLNTVGDRAFEKDKKLKYIKICSKKLNVNNVGFRAFWSMYTKPKVYVPKTKKKSYKKAFVQHGMSEKAKFYNV